LSGTVVQSARVGTPSDIGDIEGLNGLMRLLPDNPRVLLMLR